MRKCLLLLLVLGSSGSLFGIEISAGVCPSYSPLSYSQDITWLDAFAGGNPGEGTIKTSLQNLGVEAYVDATYLHLGIGYKAILSGTQDWKAAETNYQSDPQEISNPYDRRESWLTLTALGEYEMYQGLFSVTMLAGLVYDLNISVKDSSGKDLKTGMSPEEAAGQSRLWIKGGVSADFSPMGGAFYVRPLALIGRTLEADAPWAFDLAALVGYKLASF